MSSGFMKFITGLPKNNMFLKQQQLQAIHADTFLRGSKLSIFYVMAMATGVVIGSAVVGSMDLMWKQDQAKLAWN